MSLFSENYRGNRKKTFCPFKCINKRDDQYHFFECDEMKKHIDIDLSYEEFLKHDMQNESIIKLHKMINIRNKLTEENYPEFDVFRSET